MNFCGLLSSLELGINRYDELLVKNGRLPLLTNICICHDGGMQSPHLLQPTPNSQFHLPTPTHPSMHIIIYYHHVAVHIYHWRGWSIPNFSWYNLLQKQGCVREYEVHLLESIVITHSWCASMPITSVLSDRIFHATACRRLNCCKWARSDSSDVRVCRFDHWCRISSWIPAGYFPVQNVQCIKTHSYWRS